MAAVAVTTAAAIASIGTMIAVLAANPAAPKIVPTPTPTPTPTPVAVAEGPLLSPFTGEPVKSLGGVLAVKIDNIVYARPQTGLSDADIVYVLPVEGGLTRFMAIFSSHFPPVIGPVRSARKDDLELLRQFGRPAFAFSGAQGQLLPVVERSHIVDLYAGRVVTPYYRDNSRIAPYNLYANYAPAASARQGREPGAQHRVQIRPGADRRSGHQLVFGVVPVNEVHLYLVRRGGVTGW